MYNTDSNNLASWILRHGEARPGHLALAIPRGFEQGGLCEWEEITFGEFGARVASLAEGLKQRGLKPGDRVILLAPLSIELYAAVVALLAQGMSAVFIDAGMGFGKVYRAFKDAEARAVISMGALLKHRFWLPVLWGMKMFSVDSRGLFLTPFEELPVETEAPAAVLPRQPGDHGLITFTSGSTGRPKGADRTHGLLLAQHLALEAEFPGAADDVDMPCFPVVTLHNLCSGISTVIPPVNFRAPGSADGGLVAAQLSRWQVTRLSGAPAYMARLVSSLESTGAPAGSVRRVVVGGGPVTAALCARIRQVFPRADCSVIYGCTEVDPIASIDMKEVEEASGEGFLVGCPAEAAEVALVDLPDPAPRLDAQGLRPYLAAPGQCGEVVVKGAHVLTRYLNNPEADREDRLREPGGALWQRTGDMGHRDARGRLWLTGRRKDLVAHKGQVIHPLPLEGRLDALPGIRRSALLQLDQPPRAMVLLALEPEGDAAEAFKAVEQVLASANLTGVAVQEIGDIPMDSRHNSKIDRPLLRDRISAGRKGRRFGPGLKKAGKGHRP